LFQRISDQSHRHRSTVLFFISGVVPFYFILTWNHGLTRKFVAKMKLWLQ